MLKVGYVEFDGLRGKMLPACVLDITVVLAILLIDYKHNNHFFSRINFHCSKGPRTAGRLRNTRPRFVLSLSTPLQEMIYVLP